MIAIMLMISPHVQATHDPATGHYAHSDYYFQTYADTKAACQASLSGWPTASCGAGTGFASCIGHVGDGFLNTKTGDQFLHCTCPPHASGTPCACDAGYVFDAARTSCVAQNTVTLQTLLPDVEPSGTTNVYADTSRTVYALVTDKQTELPKIGVQVKFSVDVIAGTGGHDHHDALRPKGKQLDCRDNTTEVESTVCITQLDGKATVTFKAPGVSGTHTINAECVNPVCAGPVSGDINVKVPGLAPIPVSPFYSMQLPNRDTNHPNTFFLMKTSSRKLEDIATLYYSYTYYQSKQGVIPDFVLNDASLEWGGVLDCFLTCNSAQYPSTPWHKHHLEHRRGSVVDVKANGVAGSIVYEKKFREVALGEGVDIGNPHGSSSGRHFHLRLNNGAKE